MFQKKRSKKGWAGEQESVKKKKPESSITYCPLLSALYRIFLKSGFHCEECLLAIYKGSKSDASHLISIGYYLRINLDH